MRVTYNTREDSAGVEEDLILDLLLGDCLERMKEIPDGSMDLSAVIAEITNLEEA